MRLECRSLNDEGMRAATDILQDIREGSLAEVPPYLLTDTSLTSVVGEFLKSPTAALPTRWHLGIWLYRELPRVVSDASVLRLPGFWTWLALFLFPIIRPAGTRVYEDARYILNRDDYRKRYRHLVAGPFFVFSAHESAPQIIRGILATPPNAPGDLYEQLASRQELVTSVPVMSVVTQLYLDPQTGALKRGAGSNARRLAEVLTQYDVNFDFAAIDPGRLLEMLPREFRRFITH